MDPLEIFFFHVTSICWAVLSSDFRTDALMKTFSLYLKMLRSITSCKYSKRSFKLEKWLWPNMCSLPLEQLCSKSYELPITIKFTEIFLATAGQLSWQQEDISREPWDKKIARTTNIVFLGTNQTNLFHYQNFGLEQITLRRNGLPYQVQQFKQKIINVSSSTHYQCWVCCTAGWETLWITTSSTVYLFWSF